MEMKCDHCHYTWDYNGKSKFYATCPRCRWKVKIDPCKICDYFPDSSECESCLDKRDKLSKKEVVGQ